MPNKSIMCSVHPTVLVIAVTLPSLSSSCRFEGRRDTSKPDGGDDATTTLTDDRDATEADGEQPVTGGSGSWVATAGTYTPVPTGGTTVPIISGGTTGSGAAGGDFEVTIECPFEDPPLMDPYCYNMGCPLADLRTLADDNKPMGDCCNTVDVQRREESVPEGARYDLEFAIRVNLPQNNPQVANALIQGLMENSQLAGADVTLLRFKDVPRTMDMTGPEKVTLEINSGKLNCDGTYSFYGPKGASAPIHDGPADDPGRWSKRLVRLEYNGFYAEELFRIPSADAIAQAVGLSWMPRWNSTSLDYEQPVSFFVIVLRNDPSNWSCYGSMDSSQTWMLDAKVMLFVPVEEAKLTLIPDLGNQSQCGFFAKGAYAGECDGPRDEWSAKPTGYCDDRHRCWIGVPSDPDYTDFWSSELYSGENGCGDAYPCCDPVGVSDALRPCNAFFLRNSAAVAAVDIVDEEINDPAQAISHRARCE